MTDVRIALTKNVDTKRNRVAFSLISNSMGGCRVFKIKYRESKIEFQDPGQSPSMALAAGAGQGKALATALQGARRTCS